MAKYIYNEKNGIGYELQGDKAEGVTEGLKAADQMEWVHRMNSIRNHAGEIVNSELIYN